VAGVGEIVVGERPRTRGRTVAPTALGTSTEAAVDLVRVRLLGQDVRLGHMEAAVAVPPGGVTCPGLDVSVTPDAGTVAPGDTFGAKVRVRNPNEGSAADVAIDTRFAADPGIDARPGAVFFNHKQFDFGLEGLKLTTPLGPGQSVEIPMAVRVVGASRPGRIRLGASATGHYGAGPLAVPTAGDVASDGVLVTAASAGPAAAGPSNQNPVGGKAPATAGAPAPAGSGGRRPVRASAGITGAAGSAASAAPVAPAPSVSAPPPAPAVEPAPAPGPAPAPAPAPATAPSGPPASEQTAAGKPRPKGESTDRGRWAWGGAAAVLLVAIAAAAVARLLGGASRP